MERQRSVARYAEVLPPLDGITTTLSGRSGSPLSLPLAGSHHPFYRYRFTTILATLVMAHEEDTSTQQSGQEKPVVRRDKVVVTKVTEQELEQIKSTAEQCGMTRSDFIRRGHSAISQDNGFLIRSLMDCGSLRLAGRTW